MGTMQSWKNYWTVRVGINILSVCVFLNTAVRFSCSFVVSLCPFFVVVVVLSSCQGLAQRQVLLPGSAGVMSKKKRQHESLNVSAVR